MTAQTVDQDATRWLTDEEQGVWRAWLRASTLLPDQLNRDLLADHGLTNMDYQILVELSESPDRRMRMSELAERTLASRSRLSHQVDRMEQAGLVERASCPEDRRGSFASLTEQGWHVLVAAAPDHVASVRRHLIDAMTPAELQALGTACRKIVERIQAR